MGKRGAKVVVNYHANADAANEVVQLIKDAGSDALAVQSDVSQYDAAQSLIKAATEFGGRLDILVNNAGTTRDMLLAMMPETDWDLVITTNLKSAYNCSKAALRPMMRQTYGRIVNITSVAGLAGNPGQTNYSASKAGLIGFTKSLAKEVGGRNITVNAVAPGFIPTDLTHELLQQNARRRDQGDAVGPPGHDRGCGARRGVSRFRGRLIHHRTGVERRRRPGHVSG